MTKSTGRLASFPPRPRLTLRVGFSGHRPERLPVRLDQIRAQISSAFHEIEATASRVLEENGWAFSEERPVCRLVSSLAEGGDLLAVEAVPENWELEVILPFKEVEFRRTLTATDSLNQPREGRGYSAVWDAIGARDARLTRILEIDDASPFNGDKDSTAYERLALLLLGNVDLLIVLWDGLEQDRRPGGSTPPLIKAGGTAWTAFEAVRRGMIVVWIDTTSDAPPRIISHAREPHQLFGVEDVDSRRGPLRKRLVSVLSPPSKEGGNDASGETTNNEGRKLGEFLAEPSKTVSWSISYALLAGGILGQWPRIPIRMDRPVVREKEWTLLFEDLPSETDSLIARLRQVLLPRFLVLDNLANQYGHAYRSIYVQAFLLSGLAVVLGLLSQFWHESANELDAKALICLAELAIIGGIILIVRSGRGSHAHERWLNYRSLAETLRHQRFLALIGSLGSAHAQLAEAHSAQSWVLWYAKATIREIGLPSGALNNAYCWMLLERLRLSELKEQQDYHIHNSENLHRLHRVLHRTGDALFVLTAIVLTGYLIPWLLLRTGYSASIGGPERVVAVLDGAKPIVTLFAAGLPALGAALAGIRVQGDFEGFALRSKRTAAEIEELMVMIEKVEPVADIEATREILIEAARVMSEDLTAWQSLYGRKELMFPA